MKNLFLALALVASCGIFACNSESKENKECAQECKAQVELKEVNTPEEAIARLKEGNVRYAADSACNPHNNHQRIDETAPHQAPFCAVVACSDSRVPVELIFDQGIGDIFVIRTAGNSVNDDVVMGSVDYAIEHLKVKAVVVMGHESCGGVTGAITEEAEANDDSKIDELLDVIRQDVKEYCGHAEQLNDAIMANTKANVERIKASKENQKLVEEGKLVITGAFYNVHDGKVVFD